MSLVYNQGKPQYSVQSSMNNSDEVTITVSADIGKFGTDEIVAEYTLSVSKLIAVLDYQEE